MASKECFHFTTLERLNNINKKGLEARSEEHSKSVSDSQKKISYSDSKIGAIGLYCNFEQVYLEFKVGIRPKRNTPEEFEMRDKILQTKDMEEFLGDGVYLMFDGTGIDNTGGNTGHGGIYDASTYTTIPSNKLRVCLIKDNDTGTYSYSRKDFIHFLMASMTEEEFSGMIEPMQERYQIYYESHKEEIDKFKKGNFSRGSIPISKFCEIFKADIDKASKKADGKQSQNFEDETR